MSIRDPINRQKCSKFQLTNRVERISRLFGYGFLAYSLFWQLRNIAMFNGYWQTEKRDSILSLPPAPIWARVFIGQPFQHWKCLPFHLDDPFQWTLFHPLPCQTHSDFSIDQLFTTGLVFLWHCLDSIPLQLCACSICLVNISTHPINWHNPISKHIFIASRYIFGLTKKLSPLIDSLKPHHIVPQSVSIQINKNGKESDRASQSKNHKCVL